MLRLTSLSGILSFSQSGQLVLMVIAFCLGTCMKASAPLPDCSIDNALVQFFPPCIDWLAQLINVFNSALINLFLPQLWR